MSGIIRRVVLGMSGGVDSSVAALLLKNKGFDVHGVYMKNWDDNEETGTCNGARDAEDAEWVCKQLQIPFHQVNFVKEYWNSVFTDLVKEYSEGWTPNPDVLCNKFIKFDCFHQYAFGQLGADAVATGHYANNSLGQFLEDFSPEKDARLLLPKDLVKDQTIFLSQVHPDSLRRVMFPLASLKKAEVKQIAAEKGLERIAKKKESMGICFIGSRNFQTFIDQYLDSKPGKFIDVTDFQTVGEHSGIHHFTLGQKCKISGLTHPYFVVSKSGQDIMVAPGTHHPALYSDLFYTSEPHWINGGMDRLLEDGIFKCQFRFQNTHRLLDCVVGKTSANTLVVKISTNMRALSPGQFTAFYKDGECLGSARIRAIGPSLFLQGLEFNKDCAKTDQDLLSVEAYQ